MGRITMRRSVKLHFIGMVILFAAIIVQYAIPLYLIRQQPLFESMTQLKEGGVIQIKSPIENTKIKVDLPPNILGDFKKYSFTKYFLQIISKEGKKIAILVPRGFNNKYFIGYVISRKNTEINEVITKYEAENDGFRFEDNFIVIVLTSSMKIAGYTSNILFLVAFILGLISLREIRKHYLL